MIASILQVYSVIIELYSYQTCIYFTSTRLYTVSVRLPHNRLHQDGYQDHTLCAETRPASSETFGGQYYPNNELGREWPGNADGDPKIPSIAVSAFSMTDLIRIVRTCFIFDKYEHSLCSLWTFWNVMLQYNYI